MGLIVDPRHGDIEDDASSTERRSLLSLAGSLLAEISLPKLALAGLLRLVLPGLLLGLAPLAASAWFTTIKLKLTIPLAGIWCGVFLLVVVAVGWFGGRALFRIVESSFWSLNSLLVEPGYVVLRESLRHFAGRLLPWQATKARHATLRAATAAATGIIICGLALLALMLAWPPSRWMGTWSDLTSLHHLAPVALANSVVFISVYLAVAALVWGIADASTAQPRDLDTFQPSAAQGRTWRIAHLSDIHVVGERYGFRIESGRSGPRGNKRFRQALSQLDALHAQNPLDVILITGDMTDAGRSAEWAEFLEIMAEHPELAKRVLVLPGNHDLNVADRANPARLELPISPNRRLRKIRLLSATCALQGLRVRVIDRDSSRLGESLADTLKPHLAEMAQFADSGRPRVSRALTELWNDIFPMVVPPDRDDGLGIILLNSNADTYFSFTNALGMISAEQVQGIEIAKSQFPKACWVVALHHHLVEYPRAAKALSERIGTALINGNWFVRRLHQQAEKIVVMHGHRHIDWIGECAGLRIISAPSPVMEVADEPTTCFYIHSIAVGSDGRIQLLPPEQITLDDSPDTAD